MAKSVRNLGPKNLTAKDIKALGNKQLTLEIPPEVRRGVYAHDALCSVSSEHFTLTFYANEPLNPDVANGTARVYLPISKLKPLRDLLDRQLKFYEKRKGEK